MTRRADATDQLGSLSDPRHISQDMLDQPNAFIAGNPTDEQLGRARQQIKVADTDGLVRVLGGVSLPLNEEWPEYSERRLTAFRGAEQVVRAVVQGLPVLPHGLFDARPDDRPDRTAQLDDFQTALLRAAREELVIRAAAELGWAVVPAEQGQPSTEPRS